MRHPTGQLYKRYAGRDLKANDPQDATFYLRYVVAGRRHALCLGVQDYHLARQLADEHLGRISRSDRESYLRSLVSLGKLAEAELAGQNKARIVSAPVDLWQRYEQSRRRPQSGTGTLAGYRAQINRFAQWAQNRCANLMTLDSAHAETYVQHLEQVGLSPYTIRQHIATLARTWRVLMPDASNPWDGLTPAGQHTRVPYRRLSLDELQALAAAATGEDLCLILLGYYAGMRLDDAATLDVSAYDAAQAILTILPSKTARRKPNPLTIPVLPQLAEALAKAPKQGPLMPSLAAEQATKNNTLSQRMARMIREAGEGDTAAGKASFHSLRATFVSMMDEAGAPQAITDSITGHAPQTMHARYSHPDVSVARTWMQQALPRLERQSKDKQA